MSENDLITDPIFREPSASRTAARTYKHRRTVSASASGPAALAPSAVQQTASSAVLAAATKSPKPAAKRSRTATENANVKTSRRDGKGKGKATSNAEASSPLVLGSRNRNNAVVTGGTPKQKPTASDHAKNFLTGIRLPLSPLTVFKDPDAPPSSPSDMSISPTRTMTPVVKGSDRQPPPQSVLSAVTSAETPPMQTPVPRAPARAITADDTPFIAEVFRTAKPAVTFADEVYGPKQPEPDPEPEPLPKTSEINVQSDHDNDEEDPIAEYGDGEFARVASPKEAAAPTARRRVRIRLRHVDPLPQTDSQDELTL
ncbi:hypothetical protein BDZ88DRAFT_451486 [Geranomyces variabilis]|nr:hypothetical protein BDZ88DRAFT_451486 [Geranomyces variabilis]KAJ3141307.1 hypothetical protein HDU90_007334 [Geranomyces variabilis]